MEPVVVERGEPNRAVAAHKFLGRYGLAKHRSGQSEFRGAGRSRRKSDILPASAAKRSGGERACARWPPRSNDVPSACTCQA